MSRSPELSTCIHAAHGMDALTLPLGLYDRRLTPRLIGSAQWDI